MPRERFRFPQDHWLADADWVVELCGFTPGRPGRQRVYTLTRKRIIPAIRLGARVVFDKAKVRQWLADGGTSEADAHQLALRPNAGRKPATKGASRG